MKFSWADKISFFTSLWPISYFMLIQFGMVLLSFTNAAQTYIGRAEFYCLARELDEFNFALTNAKVFLANDTVHTFS